MSTPSELLQQAFAIHRAGRLSEAESLYRQVLAGAPSCGEAWHYLAAIRQEAGDLSQAADDYARAVQLNPQSASSLNNLGNVLRELNRLDEAIACLVRAVKISPATAQIHNNLGVALLDKRMLAEAVTSLRRALELEPNYFEALNNLANALKDLGQLEEAVASYRRAAEMQPCNAMILDNLGLTYVEMSRLAEASECFRRSLELDPESPHVHWCQSLLLLLQGDLEHGWREYEWRWRCPEWRRATRDYLVRPIVQPVWDGSPLGGQTILLRAEQGLGDTLQFIRFVPLVKERGGRVLVECQPGLEHLLATCGADMVVPCGEAVPPFDTHAYLLSLPNIFQTTLETIPANVPYLFAESGLVEKWKARLAGAVGTGHPTMIRIGIHWRGRPEPGLHRRRDIPPSCFAALSKLPGVCLFNLQKGAREEELAAAGAQSPLAEPGQGIDELAGLFMDTSAIMRNLDLVITSDTSIAHLAGALGVSTWVVLPHAADWRWLLNRSDSAWYPTMRLFRQQSAGDWNGVFQEIEAALAGEISS